MSYSKNLGIQIKATIQYLQVAGRIGTEINRYCDFNRRK